jgi:hypothetical protein
MLKKKCGPIFKELLKFLPKKFSLCSQIYGFGIRDPEKTYSGSRIQGSKRHRIPDPQHCFKVSKNSTAHQDKKRANQCDSVQIQIRNTDFFPFYSTRSSLLLRSLIHKLKREMWMKKFKESGTTYRYNLIESLGFKISAVFLAVSNGTEV